MFCYQLSIKHSGISLSVIFSSKLAYLDDFLTMAASESLFTVHFEVFGIVQGVFFRKNTQKQALTLGVRGWCRNTADGSVEGQCEGTAKVLGEMKHWLQHVGSSQSRIDKAVFSEMQPIAAFTFNNFAVKR